jgi:16S rRNA (uracil1498-N3)-methyltransferase
VVEKISRAVIEASKQCGRNRLMQVDLPQKWDDFVARTDLPAVRILLHTSPALPILRSAEDCAVSVGPEGGFTDEEVARAISLGWIASTLGPRVLRVETAAIAAVAVLTSR